MREASGMMGWTKGPTFPGRTFVNIRAEQSFSF